MRAQLRPLCSLFGSVFYTSLGCHLSPTFLFKNLPEVLTLALTSQVLATAVTAFSLVAVAKFSVRSATALGLALASVADVSVVAVSKAASSGLVSRRTYLLYLSSTVVLLAIDPLIGAMLISSSSEPGAADHLNFIRTMAARVQREVYRYTTTSLQASSWDNQEEMETTATILREGSGGDGERARGSLV